MKLRPLSPILGAEISGIDLSQPLSDELRDELYDVFLRHQVLVFREQSFDEAQQMRFAEHWGRLQVHVLDQYHRRGNPAVITLSNLDHDGNFKGEHPDPGAAIWHTDGSWSAERPLATVLYGLVLPSKGGDTLFVDMYGAYDRLTSDMKKRLEGLIAVHNLDYSRQLTGAKKQMTEEQKRIAPPVEHPVVRIHPDTGRKTLYLGQHASHIVGMPLEEGRALIQELNALATQPQYVYAHPWKLHDVVIWDNRCVMHKATDFDWMREVRTLRRTTSLGERLSIATTLH